MQTTKQRCVCIRTSKQFSFRIKFLRLNFKLLPDLKHYVCTSDRLPITVIAPIYFLDVFGSIFRVESKTEDGKPINNKTKEKTWPQIVQLKSSRKPFCWKSK